MLVDAGCLLTAGWPEARTAWIALCQVNTSLGQGLLEFVRVETIELLLAYEHQGDALAALALKFSKSPAVSLDVLLAVADLQLAQKCH